MREIAALIGTRAAGRRRRRRRGRRARAGQPALLEVHPVSRRRVTPACAAHGVEGPQRDRATPVVLRRRARHHAAPDAGGAAGSRSASARWSRRRPTPGTCTPGPTPTLGGRGDVRRLPRGDGRGVADARSSTRCSADNSEPFGLMLGAGVMFVVGALDDLIDVSPPAKVAGQVLAASLLALLRRRDVLLPDAVQPVPHRHGGARRQISRRSSPRCGSC